MASTSTQPDVTSNKSILKLVMTLEGHKPLTPLLQGRKVVAHTNNHISSMCYFPSGKQLISGSNDKTVRRWDLRAGKEIEEARYVCKQEEFAVGVSRDGRWVVTAGETFGSNRGELRISDETGIVKTSQDRNHKITCIDISVDSTLLASGSSDGTVWITSLKTGKLVASITSTSESSPPRACSAGAIRFSQDSKKLAIKSSIPKCLEVWDLHAQTGVRVGQKGLINGILSNAPMFWTTKDKTIVAAFSFNVDYRRSSDREFKTIYEFDASTLKTVGAPFKGHTNLVIGLALSFDCALLASAAHDHTVKLWAFESRQLLASFDVPHPRCILLSPDSRQLIYTSLTKIHICDTPPDILSSILPVQREESSTSAANPRLADAPNLPDPDSSTPPHQMSLLQFDATPRAVRHEPVVSSVRPFAPQPLRPSPAIHSQQRTFPRYLRKLLPSRTNAVPPVRTDQLRNDLDFPATSPLHHDYPPSVQVTGEHGSGRLWGCF